VPLVFSTFELYHSTEEGRALPFLGFCLGW
jgi:hypothetical protein